PGWASLPGGVRGSERRGSSWRRARSRRGPTEASAARGGEGLGAFGAETSAVSDSASRCCGAGHHPPEAQRSLGERLIGVLGQHPPPGFGAKGSASLGVLGKAAKDVRQLVHSFLGYNPSRRSHHL